MTAIIRHLASGVHYAAAIDDRSGRVEALSRPLESQADLARDDHDLQPRPDVTRAWEIDSILVVRPYAD